MLPSNSSIRTASSDVTSRFAAVRFGVGKRSYRQRHAVRAAGEDSKQEQSVEDLAQELLAKDPEASAKLRRVGDAARRVAELQAEQSRLAAQMAEESAERTATLRNVEREESSNIAAAEVAAAEKLLQAAELQAQSAEASKVLLEAEMARDADRVESGKAGTVAGAAGTLASLPFILSDAGTGIEAVLTLGGVALSCLLFGVTYRYAVRTDLANNHLKGGVVGAFGLVRGGAVGTDALLSSLPPPSDATAAAVATTAGSSAPATTTLAALGDALPYAALLVGESMLTFAFASAAVELAFRQGLVKPLAR